MDTDWQSYTHWFAVVLFSGTLSYFVSLSSMGLARRSGMITQPGARQSHDVATPTGGGLGLVFSVVVTSLLLQLFTPLPLFWSVNVLPGIILLATIGWFDDRRHVSFRLRLMVQLTVSLWLIGFSGLQFSLGGMAWFLGIIAALMWMMNLYNFMDGSNGMAGFQGVFAGSVLAVLFYTGGESTWALLSLVVAAACAGFLPLNFPSARVFMGDSASVPRGFIFGSFLYYGIHTGVINPLTGILIMSVFVVDASLTLSAMVFRREQWYTAHRQHVYQRLISHGWSHGNVMLTYQIINVILVLPAILLAELYPQYGMVTAGATFVLLGACWYLTNRRLGLRATAKLT